MEKLNALKISEKIKKINEIKFNLNSIIRGVKPFSSRFESDESMTNYYDEIYIDFKKLLYKQMIQNQSAKLLLIYIEEANKIKDEIKDEIESYDIKGKNNYLAKTISKNKTEFDKFEYHSGNNILLKQHKTVDNVLLILNNLLKYIDYTTENDYKILLSEIEVENNHNEISYPNNKATFNLSKTDSIMFIYMLEKCNFIKFESTSHRNSFIENNFNYSELRNINSENKELQMKGINSDFANIKSNDKESLKRFNKNLESLKDKLQIIMDFKLES